MPNWIKFSKMGRIESPAESSESSINQDWDDDKFPATAINPPGAASDPDRDTATGLLLFDAAKTELIFALQQLPHKWREGTKISPHIHWAKSTSAAGNAAWRLRCKMMPINEVWDAAWTDLGMVIAPVDNTPDVDTANHQMITSWGYMESVMEDKQISDCILWELSRVGGDASDDYGADAILIEFDVHIQIDTLGSEELFIK
jgi:hypothetical protein